MPGGPVVSRAAGTAWGLRRAVLPYRTSRASTVTQHSQLKGPDFAGRATAVVPSR